MKILEIIRLEEGADGTFGVLRIDKVMFCFTLEPRDLLNRVNESSIPAQQYICEMVTRRNGQRTWLVTEVPGRTNIMFHPGNVLGDTAGCILLGSAIGKLRGNRAVLNSGDTFNAFMESTDNEEQLHLTILQMY